MTTSGKIIIIKRKNVMFMFSRILSISLRVRFDLLHRLDFGGPMIVTWLFLRPQQWSSKLLDPRPVGVIIHVLRSAELRKKLMRVWHNFLSVLAVSYVVYDTNTSRWHWALKLWNGRVLKRFIITAFIPILTTFDYYVWHDRCETPPPRIPDYEQYPTN